MNDVTLRALELAVSARIPVLLWGGPGTGKTSAIEALAARLELPCETVIASIREPSDFAGLPIVRDDGVEMTPPAWARRLAESGGVLFLDELSTAPPAVQAALLRVVLERKVGDLALPDHVRVVAAANPADQAADGWDLAPPLANRFCHLDWPTEARRWVEGIVSGFDAPTVASRDPERHLAEVPLARALVAGFVQHRPSLLSSQPSDLEQAGRAWPSPRTWTMAADLIAAVRASGESDDVLTRLVAGAVGPGPAAEFVSWQRELDLPDPLQALDDPDSFVVPERGDRAYAALTALAAAAIAQGTERAWVNAWFALAHATRDRHADLAVTSVRSLIANRPDGVLPPREVLQQMAPVLQAAGLFDRLGG